MLSAEYRVGFTLRTQGLSTQNSELSTQMSEALKLPNELFKLFIRFSNGEMVYHVTTHPLDSRLIKPETRYAVIACYSTKNPIECTDVTVVNLRDVTFIKTERVTADQLTADRRMAGMRSSDSSADDKQPKTLAQLSFV